MKLGIILHFIIGIFQLSNSKLLQEIPSMSGHFHYHTDPKKIVHEKFFTIHIKMLLSFVGLIVVLFLIDNFVYSFSEPLTEKTVYCIGSCLCVKREKGKNEKKYSGSMKNTK